MHLTRRRFLNHTLSAATIGAVSNAMRLPAQTASAGPKSAAAVDDLCFKSAHELAALIRVGQTSAEEVMTVHLRQISRCNLKINAIVAKLDDEKCLALAKAADRRRANGAQLGPLHGLPIAIKDLDAAVGFPFTRGSPIYRRDTPTADSAVVERLRGAGALLIGKTNTPEFGMGSHTYNLVYGTTLNPYDLSRSAGGSSGGAGAALAVGMLPIANGSDLGGSLRNPGNFNNIVGFRPTIGLVSLAPTAIPFGNLAVKGPLARTVRDIALQMTVMAGADGRDPASYPSDAAAFAKPLERNFKDVRVAWCPDLGGLPLDPEVRGVLEKQRAIFERLGCSVEAAHPDLSGAEEAFLTLRSWRAWGNYGSLLASHRAEMKPEAVGEIEAGAKVTTAELTQAMRTQAQVMRRMREFQERYEFVLCAVNQVPPFDAKLDWPKEIAGTKMEHYVAWMKSAYWITTTGCPAISVPAGFTSGGLPVGIQLVGRYRSDFALLQFAHMFEQETKVGRKRPPNIG
jgi:amidase